MFCSKCQAKVLIKKQLFANGWINSSKETEELDILMDVNKTICGNCISYCPPFHLCPCHWS